MKKLVIAALICGMGHLSASENTQEQNAQKKPKQPNIIMIMGDDIGWFNIGVYNRGIMAGKTPHLDQLAKEGMMFTDYYAEPSCTAGRASFITGQLPVRTGLTTVGQAGAETGFPVEAPTTATILKNMGYKTAQFGKNHFGDLNKFLPTVHGFDEFYGYLYHLNAMDDPYWHSYPEELKSKIGPRNLIHSWATNVDDPTIQPRWGKIGKQKIEDKGPLDPERMKTIDDDFLEQTFKFMEEAHKEGKPFFIWLNPTRMHVFTYLPEKYQKMMNAKNGWYIYEAGMAQLDDMVGKLLEKLKQMDIEQDTIVGFTTDNGAEVFTWPDGGMTPFAGTKGMVLEGGVRVPMIVRWPGKIPAGKVENQIMSALDWLPTLVGFAGNSSIKERLKKGEKIGERTYKVHLDGYDQSDMLTDKGPSKRNEIFYFAGGRLGALRLGDYKYRFIDQPDGWFGGTVTLEWPSIVNLRLDPFERADAREAPPSLYDFYAREMWRFVLVQQELEKLGKTFVEFPPMQKGAHFNIEGVKEEVKQAVNRASSINK